MRLNVSLHFNAPLIVVVLYLTEQMCSCWSVVLQAKMVSLEMVLRIICMIHAKAPWTNPIGQSKAYRSQPVARMNK